VARDSRQIRLEQLSEGSLLKSEMSFLPDGTPLRMQVTGSLVMERTSEAQALAFKASTDLYYGGGIAVDRPLGEVRGLRRLVMTVPTGIAIPEAPGQVFATDTGELRLTRPAAPAPVSASGSRTTAAAAASKREIGSTPAAGSRSASRRPDRPSPLHSRAPIRQNPPFPHHP